jgi:hypothetical protein
MGFAPAASPFQGLAYASVSGLGGGLFENDLRSDEQFGVVNVSQGDWHVARLGGG